jgi:hypothetical protein
MRIIQPLFEMDNPKFFYVIADKVMEVVPTLTHKNMNIRTKYAIRFIGTSIKCYRTS